MTKHIVLGADGFSFFRSFLDLFIFRFLWEGREVECRMKAQRTGDRDQGRVGRLDLPLRVSGCLFMELSNH